MGDYDAGKYASNYKVLQSIIEQASTSTEKYMRTRYYCGVIVVLLINIYIYLGVVNLLGNC